MTLYPRVFMVYQHMLRGERLPQAQEDWLRDLVVLERLQRPTGGGLWGCTAQDRVLNSPT